MNTTDTIVIGPDNRKKTLAELGTFLQDNGYGGSGFPPPANEIYVLNAIPSQIVTESGPFNSVDLNEGGVSALVVVNLGGINPDTGMYLTMERSSDGFSWNGLGDVYDGLVADNQTFFAVVTNPDRFLRLNLTVSGPDPALTISALVIIQIVQS